MSFTLIIVATILGTTQMFVSNVFLIRRYFKDRRSSVQELLISIYIFVILPNPRTFLPGDLYTLLGVGAMVSKLNSYGVRGLLGTL